MRRWIGPAVAATLLLAGGAGSAGPWRWALPAGIAPPATPTDNPMSAAKVELGRRLFHDADLSIDGTMACATCHEQRRGFADGNRTRPGVHGDPGRRNVPGLANVGWLGPLTWADPALTTLEKQALVPIAGDRPVEMGMKGKEAEIPARLGRDRCYRRMFARAFPETRGRIDLAAVAKALAAFERTLISFDSPYDRRGTTPLPPAAARGLALFEARCASCHAGPHFSDGRFHAIETRADDADGGLAEKSGDPADRGRFRTPALRNVALAAPYLHDGSAATLGDAIRRHDRLPAVVTSSPAQVDDLTAFIGALNDERFVTDPRFAYPDKACGRKL
ncbi:cytochrome c peroxidase [Sphingomonas sp. YL-JM2C]